MRIFITITLLLQLSNLSSQDFKWEKEGLHPEFIVVEVDTLSKSELYTRTINWIKEVYVNPDVVIKSTIENEMLRITGMREAYLSSKVFGLKYFFDVRYTLIFEFKEGRYKLTISELELYTKPSRYAIGGWASILIPPDGYFKKDGTIRNNYKEFPELISALLNDLQKGHLNYISKPKDPW